MDHCTKDGQVSATNCSNSVRKRKATKKNYCGQNNATALGSLNIAMYVPPSVPLVAASTRAEPPCHFEIAALEKMHSLVQNQQSIRDGSFSSQLPQAMATTAASQNTDSQCAAPTMVDARRAIRSIPPLALPANMPQLIIALHSLRQMQQQQQDQSIVAPSILNYSIASLVQSLTGNYNCNNTVLLHAAAVLSLTRTIPQLTVPAVYFSSLAQQLLSLLQQLLSLLLNPPNPEQSLPQNSVPLQRSLLAESTVGYLQQQLQARHNSDVTSQTTTKNDVISNDADLGKETPVTPFDRRQLVSMTNYQCKTEESNPLLRSASGAVTATGSQRISFPLSLPIDRSYMSRYQALLRSNLEYFVSTNAEIQYCVQGRKAKIKMGQVGIRCQHCWRILAMKDRGRGAFYYPSNFKAVYTAAQNISVNHLLQSCPSIPNITRTLLRSLRTGAKPVAVPSSSSSTTQSAAVTAISRRLGCKKYWTEACSRSGLCEDDNGGIFITNDYKAAYTKKRKQRL